MRPDGIHVLVVALAAALLVAGSAVMAAAAEGDVQIAGRWRVTTRVTQSDSPDQPVGSTARQIYEFPSDCRPGACSVERTFRGDELPPLEPNLGADGFSYVNTRPVDCIDTATGEVTAPGGADYTSRITYTFSESVTRGGQVYASSFRGEGIDTLEVNAGGRAVDCTIGGGPGGPTVQTWSYTITGTPLPLPQRVLDDDVEPAVVAVAAPGGDDAVVVRSDALGPQLSESQEAARAAVLRGDRSSFAAALSTPADAASTRGNRLVENALLAALLVLLIVFPAQIFNSTYEENHARVDAVLRRAAFWRRGQGDAPVVISEASGRSSERPEGRSAGSGRVKLAVLLTLVAIAAALLTGFLDASFGFNRPSYALFTGAFVSVCVGVALAAVVAIAYRRVRRSPVQATVKALPFALFFAAIGVLVSRLVQFEPGYMYGVVAALSFATALDRKDEGRAEWFILLAALGVSLLAWFAFAPVGRLASEPGASLGVLIADAALAALVVGGIEGLLFSIIPLRFLPGHRVSRWSWLAWTALALVVAFTFVNVLLRPAAGYLGRPTGTSTLVTYGLFATFGTVSMLFWGYFRLRPTPSGDTEPDADADVTAAAAGDDIATTTP